MNISLTFRLKQDSLPTEAEQLGELWKVATLLAPLDFPIDDWYPPADTPEHSLLNPAFDKNDFTPAALAALRAEKQEHETPELRSFGVWNGKEGDGGIVFESTPSVMRGNPLCSFKLQSKRVSSLCDSKQVLRLIRGLLEIWPASAVEVGPYKYFSMQQLFPNRPGAGWMLYLPRVLSVNQVPEARSLIPVMEGKKQTGTIIVSVIDE